jgi:hypothetical protein
MSTRPPASVQACASPRSNDDCIVVSEFPLNHHQSFRAELVVRAGKSMVSISRLKNTPNGARRTGQAFEFGAHRAAAMAKLLSEIVHALGASGGSADPHQGFKSVQGVAQAAPAKRNDTECRA